MLVYTYIHKCIYLFSLISLSLSQLDSNTTTTVTGIPTTRLHTKETKTSKNVLIKDLNWNVWCKFQPNSFDCNGDGSGTYKFYYDIKMGDCKTFKDGNCKFNKNSFSTITECHDNCRDSGPKLIRGNFITSNIYCRLQPDFGNCNDYNPMFYYDITEKRCRGFSYSGCGGNANRFPNFQICTTVCSTAVEN